MSDHNNNINIIFHFSLLNDIVLFGKEKNQYYFCTITKKSESEFKKIKDLLDNQNESCVYIEGNDKSYYLIQVTLLSRIKDNKKSMIEWFFSLLKSMAPDIYNNLLKNSSKMKIINYEKNSIFPYYLYKIPAYIWCISIGMITTIL